MKTHKILATSPTGEQAIFTSTKKAAVACRIPVQNLYQGKTRGTWGFGKPYKYNGYYIELLKTNPAIL